MTIKLTEDIAPEVGKFYMVPCALMEADLVRDGYYTIPIIGILHKDLQFSVKFSHYHIDGRFTDLNNLFHCRVDAEGKTNVVVSPDVNNDGYVFKRIVHRRIKCKRLTTGIKPPAFAKAYWDWYKSFIGKSCQGKRCPHLGTKMHEHDGALVCPLHNLKGDAVTEIIIDDSDRYNRHPVYSGRTEL